jgi:5'-nucleotidase
VSARIVFTLLLAAALAGCGRGVPPPSTPIAPGPEPGAAPPTITLSIVGTNDLHGGILQREDRGGLALLGGYVANLRAARARDGGAVLLLDAGDMWQGTLESNLNEGAAITAAYGVLGYAAATIGNHDFDFGPVGPDSTPKHASDDPRGTLKARAAGAAFPFLTANIIDMATDRPVAWPNVHPSTLVTAAGIKVGIIGVVTADALKVTMAANTSGLRIAPLVTSVAAEATKLRERGSSVVIVAAHAGTTCRTFGTPADVSSCDLTDEIPRLAAALPAGLVDAVIAGHRHDVIAHQFNGIAVAESYTGGRSFGRIDLIVDRATRRVLERRSFPPRDVCARVDPGTTRCDPGGNRELRVPATYEGVAVVPSAAVERALAPAIDAVKALKRRPLGITLATPLRRTEALASAIGNLFTDAYLAAVPGADVALNNTRGGLRADMAAGPLTYGDVFEVMPFDNRVVGVRLTGGDLRKAVTTWLGARVPAFPGFAGLRVRAACESGALRVRLLRPNGAEVGDSERLLVATTDFLATNGDGILTPVAPEGLPTDQDYGAARDVVVEALSRRGGTLREEDLLDPANPRVVIPDVPRPVTCGG